MDNISQIQDMGNVVAYGISVYGNVEAWRQDDITLESKIDSN